MWTFASERALARTAAASLVVLVVATVAFYWVQNRFRPVGGEISVPKLLWLGYAIALWVVVPALLAADGRISGRLRQAFAALVILVLARGAAEMWMLYVWLNWSPWYGIAHDLVCMTALAALALRAGWPRLPIERVATVHLAVTAAAFLPEIYFAWYMQAHFTTSGEHAVYFVPDDPRYDEVLRVTTAVVVSLSLYFPFFLFRWLHAKTRISNSTAHGT
jgi:hypothetical protein